MKEKKLKKRGIKTEKADHFDQLESFQATIYYILDAGVCTDEKMGFFVHVTVTEQYAVSGPQL